jgi:cytidine deaminase
MKPKPHRPLTNAEKKSLVAAAAKARRHASAPYSMFRVGAALLSEDGRLFSGCNVESASYGLTVCAERTAVFKALSEGARGFRAVAVVTAAKEPTAPCGACRQVLWDQCRDIDVVMQTTGGRRVESRLAALLPLAFEFGGPE